MVFWFSTEFCFYLWFANELLCTPKNNGTNIVFCRWYICIGRERYGQQAYRIYQCSSIHIYKLNWIGQSLIVLLGSTKLENISSNLLWSWNNRNYIFTRYLCVCQNECLNFNVKLSMNPFINIYFQTTECTIPWRKFKFLCDFISMCLLSMPVVCIHKYDMRRPG